MIRSLRLVRPASFRVRWLAPLVVVTALLLGCPGPEKREICGDGIDNDGNGQTDCEDRDCTGQPACVPPDYGNCAKCSQACTVQSACVTSYMDERPIPLCGADGHCSAVQTFIQPRVVLDTQAELGWADALAAVRVDRASSRRWPTTARR